MDATSSDTIPPPLPEVKTFNEDEHSKAALKVVLGKRAMSEEERLKFVFKPPKKRQRFILPCPIKPKTNSSISDSDVEPFMELDDIDVYELPDDMDDFVNNVEYPPIDLPLDLSDDDVPDFGEITDAFVDELSGFINPCNDFNLSELTLDQFNEYLRT